jgi:hypothetical protein
VFHSTLGLGFFLYISISFTPLSLSLSLSLGFNFSFLWISIYLFLLLQWTPASVEGLMLPSTLTAPSRKPNKVHLSISLFITIFV